MKASRVFAALAALAVATQGGGVPMCVSLLAEAADGASLGCAAGGSCPTGGAAAPSWINVPIVPRAASRMVVWGPSSALSSYLAPPLAPSPPA